MIRFSLIVITAFFISAEISNAQQPVPQVGAGFPGGKPIDVSGLFPGMSAKEVRSILSAHYTNQKRELREFSVKTPISNEPFIHMMFGSQVTGNATTADNINVVFSSPPSGNQLLYISRKVNFLDADRPNKEATISAIRKKFGEPTTTNETGINYFFRNGELLTEKNEPKTYVCRDADSRLDYINTGVSQGLIGGNPSLAIGAMTQAWQMTNSNKVQCDLMILVKWSRSSDIIGGRVVPNETALGSLSISVFDFQRFFATNNVDASAQEALRNKVQESLPGGKAAPKL